jgi:hypothetical protein
MTSPSIVNQPEPGSSASTNREDHLRKRRNSYRGHRIPSHGQTGIMPPENAACDLNLEIDMRDVVIVVGPRQAAFLQGLWFSRDPACWLLNVRRHVTEVPNKPRCCSRCLPGSKRVV